MKDCPRDHKALLNVRFAILTALAFVLGTLYPHSVKITQIVEIEGKAWCFYGQYDSMKAYGQTRGPEQAMVDVTRKGVRVYVPCQ